MSMCLVDFQNSFAQALHAAEPDQLYQSRGLTSQPGFSVYRNTVMKGCIDALEANYPAVARLVGEAWFRAAGAIYVRSHLPSDARMLFYGENFANFLAHFEPAADLPYLPGVARLDRLWTESHAARDAVPVDPATLSGVAPEALASLVLHPHPATRWAFCRDHPTYTIWHRNRTAIDDFSDIEWHGEGALLVRPYAAVTWHALDGAGCAFLDACSEGRTLGEASAAAIEARPDADLASIVALLLGAGAFGEASMTDDKK